MLLTTYFVVVVRVILVENLSDINFFNKILHLKAFCSIELKCYSNSVIQTNILCLL